MGVVIRNEAGLPMASMMCSKEHVTDPFAAEFTAMAGPLPQNSQQWQAYSWLMISV
jgi:hypothetical protein